MILILAFIASSAFAAKPPFRVVVDPGHGGTDFGTIYETGKTRLAEKDVTLALSKQVAWQLRAHGYNVTLTRSTDREVPLPERTALANRIGADIFLSIHMNSTQTPMVSDAEGTETYILNHATDEASRRLTRLENSVLSGSKPAPSATTAAAAAGTTPGENSDVALILKDLRLDSNLAESERLACAIQGSLVSSSKVRAKNRDRGVKQGLFYVLLGADMPSVLVEAGFLTSPRDRALVATPGGRRRIAGAIARAIEGFESSRGTSLARAGLSTCKVF
jgi:N-acetylmuramoyl-L-alanine amidase